MTVEEMVMADRLARIVTCWEPVDGLRCMLHPDHVGLCLPPPPIVLLCDLCTAKGCQRCAWTGLGR